MTTRLLRMALLSTCCSSLFANIFFYFGVTFCHFLVLWFLTIRKVALDWKYRWMKKSDAGMKQMQPVFCIVTVFTSRRPFCYHHRIWDFLCFDLVYLFCSAALIGPWPLDMSTDAHIVRLRKSWGDIYSLVFHYCCQVVFLS